MSAGMEPARIGSCRRSSTKRTGFAILSATPQRCLRSTGPGWPAPANSPACSRREEHRTRECAVAVRKLRRIVFDASVHVGQFATSDEARRVACKNSQAALAGGGPLVGLVTFDENSW